MGNFIKDYNEGAEIEEKVLKAIQKKYPLAERSKGLFEGYDIMVPEIHKTIEVKYDKLAEQTGNFAVEISRDEIPSGINASQADLWLIWYKGTAWVLATESLRHLVLKEATKYKFGGDDFKTQLALIPVEKIIYSPYTTEWILE